MGNISIKLNICQLAHVQREMTGKDGKKIKVLIIPVEENKLYVGEKGVYLDITAIEIKDRSKFSADQKDTHLLKQNIAKNVYDGMTEDQRNSMPILGNAIQWGRQEATPVVSQSLSESAVDAYNDSNSEEADDLPF